MKRNKIVRMTVLAVALVLAGVVPAAASGTKAKSISFANGTGGEITAMQIRPAKTSYPNNENCMAFRELRVRDGEGFIVVLSEQMKDITAFDIEIVSSGKRYVSRKQGVAINLKNRKPPTVELSRKGKDSTFANIGAAAGGVAGVGAVTGTATALYTGTIMIGQAVGAAAIAEALGVAGGIVGGGMLSGVGVVAAVPVALGVGGFFVGRALTPRGLDIQVYYN